MKRQSPYTVLKGHNFVNDCLEIEDPISIRDRETELLQPISEVVTQEFIFVIEWDLPQIDKLTYANISSFPAPSTYK